MTEGKPLGLILSFALPLLLGNLLQQLYNVADAAIVGRFLGANALAAVGGTSSVQFLIIGFCIGVCSGFCIPLTQRFGAKDYSSLRRYFFNSILLTAIGAVVFTVFCALFCSQILRLLCIPSDIWKDTYAYLLVIFLGIPFTLMYNLTAGILRSVGDSRTPFVILAFSTVLNIFLDIMFIAVFHWGCAGAAAATIASQGVSGFLCTWVIRKKYEILHMSRSECVWDASLIKKLLVMGLPMGFQFSITAVGSMVMQAANNSLGSTYVSAFTAAARIKMFAMCPMDAIATGVSVFCSQNFGAGKASRVEEGFRLGAFAGIGYGIVSGLLLILFGRTACLIFLDASEVGILDAAALYLNRNGLFFWSLGLLNVSRITVQGLGFSGRAVFSGVMEMLARCMVGLGLVPMLGYTAICIADAAAWIAADLYIFPMCLITLRKVRRILKQEEEEKKYRTVANPV